MSKRGKSVFSNPDAAKTLSTIHDKYAVVPADKAPNNIVFVCKTYYIQCLINELGIDSSTGKATTLSKEEITDNHRSVLSSFGVSIKDDDLRSSHFVLDTQVT